MTLLTRIAQRAQRIRAAGYELGMTTAEYAVGTIAAVAFAAVLYRVVQSGAVQDGLTALIQSALNRDL